MLHCWLHICWGKYFDVSCLRYIPLAALQHQVVVKLLGSFRPTRGFWPTHQNGIFAGSTVGTLGTSLRRSQSQHLTGKTLRLLKKITVISAVCWSLAPLKKSFRYQYWAGVTDYTDLFRLAVGYVFIKQSRPFCNCILQQHLYKNHRRNGLFRSYAAKLLNSLTCSYPYTS